MSARSRQRPALKERVREAISLGIIDAVEEVAVEQGLENTSIAAIAARAGVAVGTLYNYFDDRDDIFAAWLENRRAQLVPRIVDAAKAKSGLPFEQRLREFLVDVLTLFDEWRRFIRVLAFVDHASLRRRTRQRSVLEVLYESFEQMLRAVDPRRSESYARMLVGSVRAVAQQHAQMDTSMTASADLIADVYLHGVKPL